MVYSIALGSMVGSIDFDERMNWQELELVKEMLVKAINNRQDELRRSETLTLSDEITRLYPPISARAQNCLFGERGNRRNSQICMLQSRIRSPSRLYYIWNYVRFWYV